MNRKLLSVIVPVYNAEEYIGDCIDSLINQNYKNLEIILVDDGSSDLSGQICDEYAKKDNRIRVYHIENSGPSEARNVGMKVMKGHYLAFADADDMVRPEMYQQLIEFIEQKNVQMAIGTWLNHDLERNITYEAELGYVGKLNATRLKKIIVMDDVKCGGGYPWNRVLDYDYVLKHSNNSILYVKDLITYEDKCWILDVCDVIKDVYISECVCYDYYIRDTSLSHNETLERQLNVIDAWKYILSNLKRSEEKDIKSVVKIFKEQYFNIIWNLRYSGVDRINLLWRDYKQIKMCRDFHIKHIIKFILLEIIFK